MDKLRSSILTLMKGQDRQSIQASSQCIIDNIRPYLKPHMRIAFYMAMPYEVQLDNLKKQMVQPIDWAIPKVQNKGIMAFYQMDEHTILSKSKWGIQEPQNGKEIPPEAFDIMLIPMVGFDEQKHRIGHGAGYYDRYLAHTSALKIGVAFELQKCDSIAIHPHDIDMDIIITEKRIYK